MTQVFIVEVTQGYEDNYIVFVSCSEEDARRVFDAWQPPVDPEKPESWWLRLNHYMMDEVLPADHPDYMADRVIE